MYMKMNSNLVALLGLLLIADATCEVSLTSSDSQVVCTFTLSNTQQLHFMTVAVENEHCVLRNGTSNKCRLSNNDCERRLTNCGLLEQYKVDGNDSVSTRILTFNKTVDGEEICCLFSLSSADSKCVTYPLHTTPETPTSSPDLYQNNTQSPETPSSSPKSTGGPDREVVQDMPNVGLIIFAVIVVLGTFFVVGAIIALITYMYRTYLNSLHFDTSDEGSDDSNGGNSGAVSGQVSNPLYASGDVHTHDPSTLNRSSFPTSTLMDSKSDDTHIASSLNEDIQSGPPPLPPVATQEHSSDSAESVDSRSLVSASDEFVVPPSSLSRVFRHSLDSVSYEEVQEKQETISGFIPFLSSDTYGLRKRRPLTYEGVQMVTDAQEERDTLPDYTTSVVSFSSPLQEESEEEPGDGKATDRTHTMELVVYPKTPVLSCIDDLKSFVELSEYKSHTCFEVVQCDESVVGPTQNGDDGILDNLASIQETNPESNEIPVFAVGNKLLTPGERVAKSSGYMHVITDKTHLSNASFNNLSKTAHEEFSPIDSEEISCVKTPPTLNQNLMGISETSHSHDMTHNNQVLPILKSSHNFIKSSDKLQVIHASATKELAIVSNCNQSHQVNVPNASHRTQTTTNHTKAQYQAKVKSFPVVNVDVSVVGLFILSQFFLSKTCHSDKCIHLDKVPFPNPNKCLSRISTENSLGYTNQRIKEEFDVRVVEIVGCTSVAFLLTVFGLKLLDLSEVAIIFWALFYWQLRYLLAVAFLLTVFGLKLHVLDWNQVAIVFWSFFYWRLRYYFFQTIHIWNYGL